MSVNLQYEQVPFSLCKKLPFIVECILCCSHKLLAAYEDSSVNYSVYRLLTVRAGD
jgi:hypothetical protein